MLGEYAASFLPAIFIPIMGVGAFVSMGLFFLYIEGES